MAIPSKYQGKSFADIANKIQNKYKDRYDAVSIRGLNKEVKDLKAAQEYARAKKEMQEQLQAQQQQQLEQQQNPQQEFTQDIQAPQQVANNQGVGFNPTQPQDTFKRQASSDYNEKFANGGTMTNEYGDGTDKNGMNSYDPTTWDYDTVSQLGNPMQQPQMTGPNYGVGADNNYLDNSNSSFATTPTQFSFAPQASGKSNSGFTPKTQMGVGLGLQAAPLVSNLIQGLTMKPADDVPVRQVSNQGLAGLRNFRARESRFEDIDLDNIERGMTEASGRFTQNNLNASRGNAGAFVANELGNQNNLYRSIADARMKAQIADRETDQLNASEKARVDQMNLQKESQVASLQGRNDIFNTQMQAQADVQNQQNDAAYDSFKSDLLNTGATSIANIGSTMFGAGQMGEMSGYDIFGQYIKKLQADKQNQSAYGGMIKRKDGSYSQKGLWDHIRAKRGSGKKPTKAMLEQERKINSKAMGGMVDTDPTKKVSKNDTAIKVTTEYGGGTGIDREPNPNYIYDEPNEQGIGTVTRLKPAYTFTGDDKEAQASKVKSQGKDSYEKYRVDFIKQLGKGKVDKSKYIVNDNNQVILKDGYIMLGEIDKAEYRNTEDEQGTMIQYRTIPKTNKKAYGGLSTIKKLRKKK